AAAGDAQGQQVVRCDAGAKPSVLAASPWWFGGLRPVRGKVERRPRGRADRSGSLRQRQQVTDPAEVPAYLPLGPAASGAAHRIAEGKSQQRTSTAVQQVWAGLMQ